MFVFSLSLYSKTLSDEDISIIDSLLQKKDLNLNDLKFEKDWASSTKLKLPVVVKILDNPLYFPVFVDSVKNRLNYSNPDLFWFSHILFKNISKDLPLPKLKQNILSPDDIFEYVYNLYMQSFYHQQLAFINLSETEKRELKFLSYDLLSEDIDSTRYKEFYQNHNISQYDSLKSNDIVSLISKINFSQFYAGAYIFYKGFYNLKSYLKTHKLDFSGEYTLDTKFGKFFISTLGKSNFYDEKFAFILDVKGNDEYTSEINTDFYKPYFCQIDLSGDDIYENNQIGGLFSSRFGYGVHYDAKGDDIYKGGDYSFSSWCGYLLSIDQDGSDFYRGGLHSLGAASIGLSYLYDAFGDDIYSATEFAEGFASVLGVGILADTYGNDIYYCGGKYLHSPLAPDDYRTMSHGYGYGIRPDIGGGVGILFDKSGNDYYDGGVFSIGGAYWYALGIVIDEKGNDFYNSVYYPQGSGIHLAGGFLLDESGEDSYYSKHGPGMGAGHDFSVGFLIDKSGNDEYSIEGGLGLGLTNSVGVFIDENGNDRYVRKYSKNLGWANKSRDTGGIGIFIDKEGKDEYSNEFAKNDTMWQRGYFGFAVDLKGKNSIEKTKKSNEETAIIDSLLPIKNIFKIASGWGVNSNAKRVNAALKILIHRDKEAAKYIAENKMNTKSGLTYRAIKKFTLKSKEMKKYFATLLDDSDTLVVKNTISLIGVVKDSTYMDRFEGFLKEHKFIKTVLSALGNIKTNESVKILSEYINDKSEIIRVIVARGLFKMKTPKAREVLQKMRKDKSFLIKAMFMIKEEKK